MADHGGATEFTNATGNDWPEHQRTYNAFLGMTKWGTIVIVAILALMAFFLT